MTVDWVANDLTAADLALLGTLGSVLPALETLCLYEPTAGPDGVQRLAEGLGAGETQTPRINRLRGFLNQISRDIDG
eukprot:scaffold74833_cov63-Phaeocystis_antarctica.AAC.2